MAPVRRRSIAVAAFVAVSFAAFDVHGQTPPRVSRQTGQPTALEVAQLPKFCWEQYHVPNATGDEFRIRDCGVWTNHYCGSLLHIIRAKAAGNKGRTMDHLGLAAQDIRYTENGIKGYPRCSITEHVAASKAEVMNLQRVYSGLPSGAK